MDTEAPFYPLRALVCGYEKSGTTLLNEILRRHPQLDSGFEGGFLLGDSPRAFPGIKPYYGFFKKKWRVDEADMAYICDTDDWGECYRRVRERSQLISDKSVYLFDKTPIYMRELDQVMAKVPGLPCIVSVRDPRALMHSWARWSGHTEDPGQWISDHLDDYVERYLDYARGYRRALPRHGQRLWLNQFEQLCLEPEKELAKIFDFLGLSFEPEFMSFSSEHFVYGNSVSTEYLYPYRGELSAQLCAEILERTASCADWHFG